MDYRNDVVISTRDAETLAYLLRSQARAPSLEPSPADALADLLMDASLVSEALTADRVALRAPVTYLESPGEACRTVTLVLPQEVDAAARRISILSPIGLALIGRKRGARVALRLPHGKEISIRIVEISRPDALREAA